MARGQRIRRIAVGEPRILIIGYGNTLRSDDGIGPRAAELLGECCDDDRITIVACHQLTPELAPVLAEAGYLILLDAEIGGEPGHIRRRDLTPAPASKSVLSHAIDARGLLAIAQLLYEHAPPTTLFTVTGGSFAPGDALTPPVEAALPLLLASVREIIDSPTPPTLSRYCKPTGI
jgi:hydrogenase maturation protease